MDISELYMTNPYQAIESWWGEELSDGLARRVCSSPLEQIAEFKAFVQTLTASGSELPARPVGSLRPIVKLLPGDYLRGRPRLAYIERAITLLLYVDDVALEDPLHELGEERASIASVINALLRLKPVADAGLVTFFGYSPRWRHPSRTHWFTTTSLDELGQGHGAAELLRDVDSLIDRYGKDQVQAMIFGARGSLGTSILIAQESKGGVNILASNAEEAVLLPVGLRKAALSSSDTRNILLSRLASVRLPQMNTSTVASIRSSSAEFAEWRRSIGTALGSIDGMRADEENWQQEARGIIASELAPVRQRLEGAVSKSPALAAARTGMLSLTYSGIGAVIGGIVGGNPVTAAVGAGGTKASEFAVNYLRGLKGRRSDRAVLDLALSFSRDPDADALNLK